MATSVGCGPDLSRTDGSLAVRLIGAGAELTTATLFIDHDGFESEIATEMATELEIESVPAGRSQVRARADGMQSNRLSVRIFEGETTRVGLTLIDDPAADPDGDGLASRGDNCPFADNAEQTDADRDGLGDACDNCLSNSDPDQTDLDGDGFGNLCDPDADGDGVLNVLDGCPLEASGTTDDDRDGVCDSMDNCVGLDNPDQNDCDGDEHGDACDADIDGDAVANAFDICPFAHDPEQTDSNQDGIGDACQDDPLACRAQVGG